MKLKRSDIKQIVKECLVEILAEGIGNNAESLTETVRPRRSKKHVQAQREEPDYLKEYRNKLDNTRVTQKEDRKSAIIEQFAKGNDVMADIFRDTADSTLAKQAAADGKKRMAHQPHDAASAAVANNPIESLFEGSHKWADLAFSAPKNR